MKIEVNGYVLTLDKNANEMSVIVDDQYRYDTTNDLLITLAKEIYRLRQEIEEKVSNILIEEI